MITYRIKNFNAESEAIVKEVGGRVFGLLGNSKNYTALVEVPMGQGFVYRHKEILADQDSQDLQNNTLVLREI
jgi:hypothetical protein